MKKLFAVLIIFSAFCLSAQNVIQWRGTDRSGIFNETDLLQSWSDNGPKLLWHRDGLGEGYSSPAIADNKIYVTGKIDGNGYIFVFDRNGTLLNRATYGAEWERSYNGARGTPTISDGRIFIHTGLGDLVCLDKNTLNVIWRKNMMTDFGGENIRWGVTESPLVIGNKVILSVGGQEHNIVALNVKDGSLVWTSRGTGTGDLTSYCSPLFIDNQEIPQIVTTMSNHIIGLEAATGKLLWSHPYANHRRIHPNTPVYDGRDMILIANGYDKGAVMLRLTNGGRSVEKVWENHDVKSIHGGIVKVGNYAFLGGDGRASRFWHCVNWYTGEAMWRDNSLMVGAVIADGNGMLYLYTERGEMALVRPSPEKLDIVSQFTITLGTGQHWAHPIIYQGVLYVRRGDTLMAFDIRK